MDSTSCAVRIACVRSRCFCDFAGIPVQGVKGAKVELCIYFPRDKNRMHLLHMSCNTVCIFFISGNKEHRILHPEAEPERRSV